MLWFSVRQETAEVCGSRLTNRIQGWAYLKCIRLSAHYRFIKFASEVAARFAVTVSGEVGCCSTAIMEVGPIIELMCFTFLVIAWCLKRLEHPFLFACTCPAWSLAILAVQSSTASYVHLFMFSFLSHRRGLVIMVSWKTRGLSVMRARSSFAGGAIAREPLSFAKKDLRSEVLCSAKPKVFRFFGLFVFFCIVLPCGCF
jgi:hypothetical protein